ncbi:nose resistant to fluoxetine protein 6-like [Danaus plexippus]|uniref:nose resistant to fluoxetine protein 6-like n=1 Tax=Danaus plexippus TaxID=13037 RepID=UPI002AB1AB96|nr:nose resistant to fluoxetine protein 6-like [Danaus plexippus]
MECLKKLVYLVMLLAVCDGSSEEINETSVGSFPPLYALEDWKLCQNPGDVYCIVDALLVSTNSSPLLQQIQEYSSRTLKHFNRTVVHRGVCVTKCGGQGPDTWNVAAEGCINTSLEEYGLEADVQDVGWCRNNQPTPMSTSARVFVIVCATLLAMTLIATGLHALEYRFGKFFGNKYILAFSLKRNWKMLIYDDKQRNRNERTEDLSCIDGIRFIGTLSVVLTHVTIIHVFAFIDNPDFIENLYEHVSTKSAFNTPLWIQAFISISGFLSAYYLLIYTEKHSFTWKKCVVSVLHRYIRLTPVSLFTLWFTISWLPRLGSGPQWSWLVEQEAQYCTERGWYHALYIHNYLTLGKLCMGHTWYLAVDMQLHVLGSFLLLILMRWRKAVIPVLATIVIASMAVTGLLVYFLNLTPIISAQSPETVRNMFKGSAIMPTIYLPVWVHFAGYALGIATAYIHYNDQNNGYKLRDSKWFSAIFHTSLLLAAAVSVAGVPFLSDSPPPSWVTALYASVDKILVALFFNVFLLGCLSRCKSVFRDLLSWRGWYSPGRLSYSVFIIHFVIMRFTIANNPQIIHITGYSSLSLLIVGTVLSYLISVPVFLVIEMPFIQLWKAVMGLDGPKKDAQAQETQNKIDLVMNGSRRSGQNVV